MSIATVIGSGLSLIVCQTKQELCRQHLYYVDKLQLRCVLGNNKKFNLSSLYSGKSSTYKITAIKRVS